MGMEFQVRYTCCHGYQRSKAEPACSKVSHFLTSTCLQKKHPSKVTMKTLEETVKEQGGEEFLAMVKEVRKKKEN